MMMMTMTMVNVLDQVDDDDDDDDGGQCIG